MFRAQAAATPKCARRGVHNTTCCTHTISRSTCVHIAQVPCSMVSCVKDSHPHMFHPPSLLFPHGHFEVRFRSSPVPPSAMTFPRSVSTPSRPRRASPLSGPVSGSQFKEDKENVGNGKLTGCVSKETMSVSSTIMISVQKPTSQPALSPQPSTQYSWLIQELQCTC